MRNSLSAASAPTEIMARAAADAPADGGRRMILLTPRCVTIRRSLRGVKMRLLVPRESYNGVVISHEGQPFGALFSLRLWHRDPEISVTLLTSNNRRTSIKAWHRWAAYFALPELIDSGGFHGQFTDASAPGSKASVPVAARRRSGRLPNRRSRLALRRALPRAAGSGRGI